LAASPVRGAPAAASPCAQAAAPGLSSADWERLAAVGARLDEALCRVRGADGRLLTAEELAALLAPPGKSSAAGKRDPAALAAAGKAAAGVQKAAGLDGPRLFDNASEHGAAGGTPSASGAGGGARPGLAPVLTAELEAHFAGTPVGRELLERFRGPSGAVELPAVVVTDLGGGSVVGMYDHESRSLWIDERRAAQDIVDAAALADRPALKRRLAKAGSVDAYLTDHLEARAAVLNAADGTLYHELTHAWQRRRDGTVAAAEGQDPVEWEHEAYREELRYFHEKLLRDPAAAAKDSDMTMYRELLRGYDSFKDNVTLLYQQTNGSSSFPTLEQALAKRSSPAAARDLKDLQRVSAAYAGREKEFVDKVLPGLREQGYPALISQARAAGDPALALSLAAEAPADLRSRLAPPALAETTSLLSSDPPAAIARRLDAWQAYLSYEGAVSHSNVIPEPLFSLYKRDYRAAFDERLTQARLVRGKARADALAWAKCYAAYLPDKAALTLRVRAVENAK
jgi:hypothetical protein